MPGQQFQVAAGGVFGLATDQGPGLVFRGRAGGQIDFVAQFQFRQAGRPAAVVGQQPQAGAPDGRQLLCSQGRHQGGLLSAGTAVQDGADAPDGGGRRYTRQKRQAVAALHLAGMGNNGPGVGLGLQVAYGEQIGRVFGGDCGCGHRFWAPLVAPSRR